MIGKELSWQFGSSIGHHQSLQAEFVTILTFLGFFLDPKTLIRCKNLLENGIKCTCKLAVPIKQLPLDLAISPVWIFFG